MQVTCPLPPIGLGVFEAGELVYNSVRLAIDCGCRHIDTAAFYGNEAEVGRAVRECGIKREQIFVASKLWPLDYDHPQQGFEESLRRLGLDYVDAYLLHWPGTDSVKRLKAWECVLGLSQKGLIHYPAVSNFLPVHLTELKDETGELPAYDQMELHPWYRQQETVEYCRENGMKVVAWAPLYRGRAVAEPGIQELAQKYARTPAQITLRWHIQHEYNPIPKSVTPKRIEENFRVFDFALSAEDMARMDGLEDGDHMSFNPMTFNGIIDE